MKIEEVKEKTVTPSEGRPEQPQRVLIVEDDGSVSAGLERALDLEGYRVESVDLGAKAVARLVDTKFDLVVLDIGLPDIDGFEVLRRLRSKGHSGPVLVLTARDAVGDRVRGLDLGTDDYMCKPFALPEVVARIRALIRRSHQAVDPRTTHGPLEIDQAGQRAFLSGAPLDLARREWTVLKILLERVDKVVSKEAFVAALTGGDSDLSSNAIEVYVSRLRSKLEPSGIRIRTVRGFGYMLEEFQDFGVGNAPPQYAKA